MNVVGTLFKLKVTCEPGTKPLPFTVRVNPGSPAVALVGEILETASGAMAGPIVSVAVLDVPPPGTPLEGLVTVILSVPGARISAVKISKKRNPGLTYAVAWSVPLRFTTELVTKPEPNTNNANGIAPAATLEGLMEEMTGEGADTRNSTDVEAPPPGSGLNTKTTAVPPLSISVARILAFSCVELTNTVLRGCPPKYTVAPGTKFAPWTCKVNAMAVAVVEGGESEEIMGTGFSVVDGAEEIANWAPLLLAESVHGVPKNGLRIPEDASMEKPMICAKPVNPVVYFVDVEYANWPVGSTTMEVGLIPAANGEPATGVSAPVPELMTKAEMLPSYWLGVSVVW